MTFNLVIPVYNRLSSLQRLLGSIEHATINGNMNLTVSCDGGASADVVEFAQAYKWDYGRYNVILQTKQLGVDLHNLTCMRMAQKLGNVVILEDDLVVSPSFHLYLLQVQNVAKVEKKIAGISLYRYPMVEQRQFPFELIPNDEFVYYQQRPSSKGCFYTWDMLAPYFKFLDTFTHNYTRYFLPKNVQAWGDEVWEKSFYCYLQKADMFLAFPRYSLSTDFADLGVHMQKQTTKYAHQSALYLGSSFGTWAQIEETDNVFDAFYEVSVATIKRYIPTLVNYDLEIDMLGYKDLDHGKSKYVLSSKKCSTPEMGWERRLKPELNNILLQSHGDFYTLGLRESFENSAQHENLKEKFLYYYPDTKLSDLVKMKWAEVISRFLK